MHKEDHIQRIIEYHSREAEDEYYRKVGDDPVYDGITWSNIEPFLLGKDEFLMLEAEQVCGL